MREACPVHSELWAALFFLSSTQTHVKYPIRNRFQNVEVLSDFRLEHITVATGHGVVRWHFIRRGKAEVNRAAHGLDWWRVESARKGLLHKFLIVFKRMLGLP